LIQRRGFEAAVIIKKQLYIDLYEVDEEKNLYNTTRNEGGFGSTG
jgi:dUTPase